MSKPETILFCDPFDMLLEYAEGAVIEGDKTYFRFPVWFEKLGKGKYAIHAEELPEDLSEFITKAGLGGDNPCIQKIEL